MKDTGRAAGLSIVPKFWPQSIAMSIKFTLNSVMRTNKRQIHMIIIHIWKSINNIVKLLACYSGLIKLYLNFNPSLSLANTNIFYVVVDLHVIWIPSTSNEHWYLNHVYIFPPWFSYMGGALQLIPHDVLINQSLYLWTRMFSDSASDRIRPCLGNTQRQSSACSLVPC